MATRKPESVPEAGDGEQAASLIDAFLKEFDALGRDYYDPALDIASFPSVQKILGLPRDQQVPVVLEAIARQTEDMRQCRAHKSARKTSFSSNQNKGFKELINDLLRKKLPFRLEDIDRLVQLASEGRGYYSWQLSLAGILRVVENFCREGGIPDCLRPRLVALRDILNTQLTEAGPRDAIKRLDQILAPAPAAASDTLLTTDEAWTRYLRGQLDGLEPAGRTA
jgi:hypothetical protein